MRIHTPSSHITSCLHDRPRSVIIHCLDRNTNSTKILVEHVHDIDSKKGVFEVETTSGSKQRIEFGICTLEEMPSCTCKDWLRHHIPCKHFSAIFTHRPIWRWNNLPQTYLQSVYFSTDTQALHDYFQPSTDNLADSLITDTEEHPSPESNSMATSLPKPVSIHQIVLKQCMYMLKYTQECVNTYNVMLKCTCRYEVYP